MWNEIVSKMGRIAVALILVGIVLGVAVAIMAPERPRNPFRISVGPPQGQVPQPAGQAGAPQQAAPVAPSQQGAAPTPQGSLSPGAFLPDGGLDQPENAVQGVQTTPEGWGESEQGRALARFMSILGGAEPGPDGKWSGVQGIDEVFERNDPALGPDGRLLPPGTDPFVAAVGGGFQVVGTPIPGGMVSPVRQEGGRTLQSRDAWVLVRKGDRWWTVHVRAEFILDPGGRVKISQRGLAMDARPVGRAELDTVLGVYGATGGDAP